MRSLRKILKRLINSLESLQKLMVFRADGVDPRMFHASSVKVLSLDAVQHVHLLIFLEEPYLAKRNQMSAQYVKLMMIGIRNSKLLRKFWKLQREREMNFSRGEQSVISFMDLSSPVKTTATEDIKIVDSKQLDSTIANFFYENALSFNVADTQSLAAVAEECIEFC